MILDKFLQFTGQGSSAPSNSDGLNDLITTADTATGSSGQIDLGIGSPALPPSQVGPPNQMVRDIGIGDDPSLKLLIQTGGVATGGTNLFIALAGAPDNGSGAPGAFTAWWQTPTYAAATVLAQGVRLWDADVPRPPAGIAIPRFLTLQYTSTGTFANLLIRANIVLDRSDQIYNGTVNNVLGGYAPGVVVAN